MRPILLACLAALPLCAQTRPLTLRQAVDLALKQSPAVVLARLDAARAALEIDAVKEPLLPRVFVGSGLAYTYGMPMSVEGSAPAVVQAKATRALWNPVQAYQTAQARQSASAAALATETASEDAALRVASLYLDLERATRAAGIAARQTENLATVEAATKLRVDEGRELPIEAKRAAVNLARARSRARSLESSRQSLARSLALALGLPQGDTPAPTQDDRPLPVMPESEQASIDALLKSSPELRKLEAEVAARGLEAKSFRAARLPRVDLVAQYGLMAKFNNYEDYFNRFQRHNAQLGASVQIPIFANAADEARAAQSDLDARRLRLQLADTRSRLASDARQAWANIAESEDARDIARLDLDLARDQVSLLLAQSVEGRATRIQLEQARYQEHERWILFYDAAARVELARFELLRKTGSLLAALKP